MNTFDRYLLQRFLCTFVVFFVATYGVYIVFDLCTNIRDFELGTEDGSSLLKSILSYYGFHVTEFLELAGPCLIVLSAVTVYGVLEKHSESHPILAAGIPAFRLLRPILIGGALLNLLLVLNQEVVMPGLRHELQTPRGRHNAGIRTLDPVYDYSNYLMYMDGSEVVLEERRLMSPCFILPPELARKPFSLTAESAVCLPQTEQQPGGWLLKNLEGVLDCEMLTDEGRKRIFARPNGKDVVVVSSVSFDQLCSQSHDLNLLSSAQLIAQVRNPSTGRVAVRDQTLALHSRFTRPFVSLLGIAMALPLVMRRESQSLILNMSVCIGVLGAFFLFHQASLLLGGSMIRPDLAAWFPIIITGSATVWTSGYVQT